MSEEPNDKRIRHALFELAGETVVRDRDVPGTVARIMNHLDSEIPRMVVQRIVVQEFMVAATIDMGAAPMYND